MVKTPNEFEPRKKPTLLLEFFASIFIYGPILAFFYVIVQGISKLLS